jgi:hypothetical protein
MFCPRCGEQTDESQRYCGSCGAELPKPGGDDAAESPSLRTRLGNLAGRTRRERFVTGATVLAIAVAVAAFFALDTDTDNGDLDASPLSRGDAEALDAACIVAKTTIAEANSSAQPGAAGLKEYSGAVLRSLVTFRSQVRSLSDPDLEDLDRALLAAAAEAGELSRVAREDPAAIAEQRRALEDATGEIEAAIEELGLTGCTRTSTAPPGDG